MKTKQKHNIFKQIIILTSSLLCSISTFAFDWSARPNKELHASLVEYTQQAANECQDPKLATSLQKFADQQKDSNPATYAWMDQTHDFVQQQIEIYPPCMKYAEQREYILRILDFPLHVDNYNKTTPDKEVEAYGIATQKYFDAARTKILREIETITPEKGMDIWKIYNMGFVLRTPQHTVGIDITANPSVQAFRKNNQNTNTPPLYKAWPTNDIERLTRQLDILFVTHNHRDHYSVELINSMLKAGKPVVHVAPLMRFNMDEKQFMPVFEENKNLIFLDETQEKPIDIAGIKIQSFYGNQGEKTPCNVYLLDIDGIRVTHSGDNYDREMDARLKSYPAANIIISATWNNITNFIAQATASPGAENARQVVIPAHENELGHTPGHRESYRELYTREDRMGSKTFPYPDIMVIDCGEGFSYPSLQPIIGATTSNIE